MENYIPQLEQGKKNLNGISIIIPGRRFWPSYPVGKHRKSLGNGSGIPTGNFSDFFRWVPANCLYFSVGTGRKSSEKI